MSMFNNARLKCLSKISLLPLHSISKDIPIRNPGRLLSHQKERKSPIPFKLPLGTTPTIERKGKRKTIDKQNKQHGKITCRGYFFGNSSPDRRVPNIDTSLSIGGRPAVPKGNRRVLGRYKSSRHKPTHIRL